jgi:hypothetical protein
MLLAMEQSWLAEGQTDEVYLPGKPQRFNGTNTSSASLRSAPSPQGEGFGAVLVFHIRFLIQ